MLQDHSIEINEGMGRKYPDMYEGLPLFGDSNVRQGYGKSEEFFQKKRREWMTKAGWVKVQRSNSKPR